MESETRELFGYKETPHCWVDDFNHEDGWYHHKCPTCHTEFYGHKRRIDCKVCADEGKAKWDALTQEEKAEVEKEAVKKLREAFPELL